MSPFLLAALFIFVYVNIWFVMALVLKNNGIVDIAWGLGFVGIAVTLAFTYPMLYDFQWTVLTMVVLWGLRLSIYLFRRNWGKPEDWRYAKWRRDWGKTIVWRSYLQVFLLQGSILFLIASPIIYTLGVNHFDTSPTYTPGLETLSLIGIFIYCVGLAFESIADYQLSKFKANPQNKGKVLNKGLWYYTRHPNYFGETLVWWGIFLACLPAQIGWWAIGSPILITFLLLKVSGVVMLERKLAKNPEYARYQETTSAFVPWRKKTNVD